MNNYVLITDMTCDLSADVLNRFGITAIPMNFQMGEQEYTHYADQREMKLDEFYERLKTGEPVKTSQINPMIYEEYFGELLKQGKDIVYICFTSGLSGTYSCANMIANQLMEEYPERKIVVIDSLCASIGQGLLVYLAGEQYEKGISMEEMVEFIEKTKVRCCHWFMVEDLNQLKRGGRLNSMEAFVGMALKIKPVLSVNREGKLQVISKERGTKKAISYLLNRLKQDGRQLEEQTIIVGHSHAPERAEAIREQILQECTVKEILIEEIGIIIGSHVGAGMCAVAFVGENYQF